MRTYDYEVHAGADLLERVEYEYALDGDAAGNVTQVVREYPMEPTLPGDPGLFDVFGTHFTYRKNGELRIVTQRHWVMASDGQVDVHQPGSARYLKVREFRGDGRVRHMARERDITDPVNPSLAPMWEEAVWTDYDGNLPTSEYTANGCEGTFVVTDEKHYNLGTAEIEYGPTPSESGDDTVTYTHADHLGTTRGRTESPGPPGPPTVLSRPVYTAFGERVAPDGTMGEFASAIGTRYGFVGKDGYETFESGDASPHYWGDWNGAPAPFGFVHTGARWYDPATGRFLQRDPNGIVSVLDFRNQAYRVPGDLNVYEYVAAIPTIAMDRTGQVWWIAIFDWGQAGYYAYKKDWWGAGASVVDALTGLPVCTPLYEIMTSPAPGPSPRSPNDDDRQRSRDHWNKGAGGSTHVPCSNCPLNPGLPCSGNPNCPNYGGY